MYVVLSIKDSLIGKSGFHLYQFRYEKLWKPIFFKFYFSNRWEEVYRSFIIYLEPKFRIRQMRNRFTTRNQWF